MKKAEILFKEIYLPNTLQEDYELWGKTNHLFPYIMQVIRVAQEDAIRETVQYCADNADADVNWLREDLMELQAEEDYEIYTIKSSILECAEKLISEL